MHIIHSFLHLTQKTWGVIYMYIKGSTWDNNDWKNWSFRPSTNSWSQSHYTCGLHTLVYNQITWKLLGSNIPYQLVMNPDWTQEKKPKTFKTHYYSTTFQAIDNVIIQNKNTIKHYNTCTGISRVHLMLSSVKCI